MKIFVYSLFVSILLLNLSSCGEEAPVQKVEVSAEANIDSLLSAHPDSVPLLLDRSKRYFEQYDYEGAVPDAAKAFRLDSNNVGVRLHYAKVLSNKPSFDPQDIMIAQGHFKAVLKTERKNLEALVGLASTYSFQQDFQSSFKYINQALRIDKYYRDAYVLKGSNYIKIGDLEKAKSSYQTAIQMDPEFFDAYFMLGMLYQSENNPLCVEYFASALELKPESQEVAYQLAFSKDLYGDTEGAVQIYRSMAQDTSDYYVNRALFHIGRIKQYNEKDIDSAIYYYKSALQSEPRHVESWHNLGVCYDSQGDKTRALQSFAKALKYNPEFKLSRNFADSIR